MWTILMITRYRAQSTQSVLTLLCEHLAKSSSNLNLIFKTFSHPACYHHHTGQGLWGSEASVISLVWPYVLHSSRCPTVSVSRRRVSRSSGASTQPAASPRTAHPADTTTQHRDVHNHTFTPPALLSGISTPAVYPSPAQSAALATLSTLGLHLHLWSKFIKESPLRPIIGILWSIPWLPGAGAPLPLRPSYEVVSSAGGCRGRFVFDFWTLLFSQRLSVAVAESATG